MARLLTGCVAGHQRRQLTGFQAGRQHGRPAGGQRVQARCWQEQPTEGQEKVLAGPLTGNQEQVLGGPPTREGRTGGSSMALGGLSLCDIGQLRFCGAELLTEPLALGAMDTTPSFGDSTLSPENSKASPPKR